MTELPRNARPVRDEDGFDVPSLDAWLRGRVDLEPGTPEVHQFSGGASNLTYLLRYPGRDLVLRRPPAGRKASSAHDMAREYLVQDRLRPAFPYVPTVLALCQDDAVMGADFYVMDRIPGTVLRANLPAGMELSPQQARSLSRTAVDVLVELHGVDVEATGLASLGRGSGYVERQVDGWSRRYRDARTRNVPSFEKVMGWLAANQPQDTGTCLIHNDFRLDNLVLAPGDPGRVTGVLDWEMATVGDPLMDLGGALAYWVQAGDDLARKATRRQPTHLPGMLTRREFLIYYQERTGRRIDNWVFYEVFGLFRLAVIAQQIYYRYHEKQTTNPEFRWYWLIVRYLDLRCRRLIRNA